MGFDSVGRAAGGAIGFPETYAIAIAWDRGIIGQGIHITRFFGWRSLTLSLR